MGDFVRIIRLEINNFKNVKHGEVVTPNFRSANKTGEFTFTDLLGIYGPNGSGKTAVVEAMQVLKCVLSGKTVPEQLAHLIDTEVNATFTIDFLISLSEQKTKVTYYFELKKIRTDESYHDNKLLLSVVNERLDFRVKKEADKWVKVKTISSSSSVTNNTDEYIVEKANIKENYINVNGQPLNLTPIPTAILKSILPYTKLSSRFYLPSMKFNSETEAELKTILDYSIESGVSFFFNNKVISKLNECGYKYVDLKILRFIMYFAKVDLFIVTDKQLGIINVGAMAPFYYKVKLDDEHSSSGSIPINIFDRIKVTNKEVYQIIHLIIDQINCVIGEIIPNLKIDIKEQEDTDDNGDPIYVMNLFSVRPYRKPIKLQYESQGIKRIISIMSALIAMVNNPCVCLVVDEFDSGVFEYLLGQLIEIIDDTAEGQLIFTSHNLHALEVLPKESIIFSTTDEFERYTHLKGVNTTNNLRDFYLKALYLGVKDVQLYDKTRLSEIKYAFRKAGRIYEKE